jgi:uncharacterized OB-fold protein
MTMVATWSTAEGFLVPPADEESAGFWEGTRAGELRVQSCGSCGRLRHPPRPMCPHCRSRERRWVRVSGRGTIWSFVVPHPPLLPAYAALAPYNVVVVAIEEDPTIRFVGNVVASEDGPINEVDPASIEIGLPVEVVFSRLRTTEGVEVAVPRWRLVRA